MKPGQMPFTIEVDSEVITLDITWNKHGEWDARVELNGKEVSFYERLTKEEERDIDTVVNAEIRAQTEERRTRCKA